MSAKCKKGVEGGPHHWTIVTPDGATSQGTCQNCGWIKEFSNATPESGWSAGAGQRLVSETVKDVRTRETQEKNAMIAREEAEERLVHGD